MSETREYRAVVVGAGQGGGPLAGALAKAGWRTAIVERKHAGGTCVNDGCTPTKTMIASARVAYLARKAADYGVLAGSVSVDMKKVRERKRTIVEKFRGGSRKRLEKIDGLDLIFGEARFDGPKSLAVSLRDGGEVRLAAEKIFLNTGTRPARPLLEGLDAISALDNTSIMELDAVPAHLIVLGGGYIGLEFGQMFRRFGSRVTIVQLRSQLLPREDPDVAEEVAKILREDGIEILLDSQAVRAQQESGGIRVEVRGPEGERTLPGSHLLVATGRVPNTDRLNLAAAGIETGERGHIKVNARLETNIEGIYALGDVKGGPAHTHISYDDYRVVRANLVEGGSASTDGRLVPYAVFIDPQLGRVGLTEQQARTAGLDIRVAKLPMKSVARAIETGETRGFMKAVMDARTKLILGAAVLGVEGGEVMAVLQMAMIGRVPYTTIRDGVFAHPTQAESLNNLFMAL